MRFLRRSLIGLFLTAVTVAALAMAVYTVRGAVQARLDDAGGMMPSRERIYAAELITITPGTEEPILETFGEIASRRTLQIRSRTAGEVISLGEHFLDGGRVAAGDVLLQIDTTDLEANVALARADVASARATLENARATLALEKDDLVGAQRQYDLRQTALTRQQDLMERGVSTASDLEAASLAESAAQQSVLAARSALNSATTNLASAEIALDRTEIALAEAERRLEEATITADFSGALSGVAAVEGRILTANEQIATLVDPDSLEVQFRLSTAQYARLLNDAGTLENADVTARLDVSGIDLVATGRIARESAAVGDGQTGRLLYATLDQAPGFRPGDFVTVSVREPALENVARLPSSAVSGRDTILLLGEADRLEEVSVNVIRRQGDSVLIGNPELSGREAVAQRVPQLGAGIRIRPQRESDAEAAAPGDGQTARAPAPPQDDVEMIEIDDERRAAMVSFVQGSARLPAPAKARILAALKQPQVPAQMVERIEAQMGS